MSVCLSVCLSTCLFDLICLNTHAHTHTSYDIICIHAYTCSAFHCSRSGRLGFEQGTEDKLQMLQIREMHKAEIDAPWVILKTSSCKRMEEHTQPRVGWLWYKYAHVHTQIYIYIYISSYIYIYIYIHTVYLYIYIYTGSCATLCLLSSSSSSRSSSSSIIIIILILILILIILILINKLDIPISQPKNAARNARARCPKGLRPLGWSIYARRAQRVFPGGWKSPGMTIYTRAYDVYPWGTYTHRHIIYIHTYIYIYDVCISVSVFVSDIVIDLSIRLSNRDGFPSDRPDLLPQLRGSQCIEVSPLWGLSSAPPVG